MVRISAELGSAQLTDNIKKEEAMHSPSNPEPTLEPESGPSNGHPDDHTVNIASASPSASSGLSPSNH
ncbi:hypothetical protein BDY19DRAFT_1060406 [Irpex rosettiformis]|uniref:Uncharacterized protein n=1 Tax=Irpex rosettiformis TaxID=378272 RepID=A0ACB8TQM2_9APHY|nr:hypothetical protein BDY19DRAFT_1060406 [Irpex rosettiformis]